MTYEYKCPKCEVTTEHQHSMKITPVITCTECGVTMARLISQAPVVRLMGGCWSKDGYDRTLLNDYKRGTPGSES